MRKTKRSEVTETTSGQDYLKLTEICKILKLGRGALHRYGIPAVRLGRNTFRVRRDLFEQWLSGMQKGETK
jgi:hypothetical protein